jgi:Ser/Thr protein kinase RdoA (MazF antagonist)
VLVDNLKKFSELPSFEFGNVTEDEFRFPDWNMFLRTTVNEGLSSLKNANILVPTEFKKVNSYMRQHRLLNDASCMGMVWGDAKPENIIVADGKLEAILDFESCFYGDPILALGYLFAKESRSPFFISVLKHFNDFISIEEDDIYFYAILRLLRMSKYLNTPMPTGLTRIPITSYFRGIQESLKNIEI